MSHTNGMDQLNQTVEKAASNAYMRLIAQVATFVITGALPFILWVGVHYLDNLSYKIDRQSMIAAEIKGALGVEASKRDDLNRRLNTVEDAIEYFYRTSRP